MNEPASLLMIHPTCVSNKEAIFPLTIDRLLGRFEKREWRDYLNKLFVIYCILHRNVGLIRIRGYLFLVNFIVFLNTTEKCDQAFVFN